MNQTTNLKSFSTFVNENDYKLFIQSVDEYLDNPVLVESMIDEGLMDFFKEKLDFIKELASKFAMKLDDLLIVFKNKIIFGFFSKIGWSIKKLVDIVHLGYKQNVKFQNIIIKYAKEHSITKWTDEKIKSLDEFLKKHPYIKSITGLAVAGFLIYQWIYLISFTGDIDFDFDQIAIFRALTGTYTLADIFAEESGLKLLAFITLGSLKISFPWPGSSWVLFAFSIVYTIAKYNYPSIAHKMYPILSKISKYK